MSLCDRCTVAPLHLASCIKDGAEYCMDFRKREEEKYNCEPPEPAKPDAVHQPSHYTGGIECIDYLRDKLTTDEFIGFCMGNVLKYSSRWRKKDGVQDLKKAEVYLGWAIQAAEKAALSEKVNPEKTSI